MKDQSNFPKYIRRKYRVKKCLNNILLPEVEQGKTINDLINKKSNKKIYRIRKSLGDEISHDSSIENILSPLNNPLEILQTKNSLNPYSMTNNCLENKIKIENKNNLIKKDKFADFERKRTLRKTNISKISELDSNYTQNVTNCQLKKYKWDFKSSRKNPNIEERVIDASQDEIHQIFDQTSKRIESLKKENDSITGKMPLTKKNIFTTNFRCLLNFDKYKKFWKRQMDYQSSNASNSVMNRSQFYREKKETLNDLENKFYNPYKYVNISFAQGLRNSQNEKYFVPVGSNYTRLYSYANDSPGNKKCMEKIRFPFDKNGFSLKSYKNSKYFINKLKLLYPGKPLNKIQNESENLKNISIEGLNKFQEEFNSFKKLSNEKKFSLKVTPRESTGKEEIIAQHYDLKSQFNY